MPVLAAITSTLFVFPLYLIFDAVGDRIRDRDLFRGEPSLAARARIAWRQLRSLRPADLVPDGPGEWILSGSWLVGAAVIGACVADALA